LFVSLAPDKPIRSDVQQQRFRPVVAADEIISLLMKSRECRGRTLIG
jgi:hypothetical protein